jgi:hypothetical protein
VIQYFNDVIEDMEAERMTDAINGHGKPSQQTRIFVNNRPVTMPDDHATGAEIEAAAGVPPDFKLYDAKGKDVEPDEKVKLKEGERFTAISGQDVS